VLDPATGVPCNSNEGLLAMATSNAAKAHSLNALQPKPNVATCRGQGHGSRVWRFRDTCSNAGCRLRAALTDNASIG
jgi:hypothetical protein